ncbi:MAG: thioredoxin domain-containing protein [Candidatus Thorarchaeota archaeon]
MTNKKSDHKTNRLIKEKSPYLLQHAYNPVDWYAWNDEAFEKAKSENKPIFLSIGYSTCHWCHVMAHESFEDDEVAELMNDAFINIKVDREERPDIDKIYMQVAQMMTGRGGWPLTIIMTPDKKPFYADTYIPKKMRYNKPGMVDLIPRIDELWKNDQENITDVVERIMDALDTSKIDIRTRQLDIDVIERGFESYTQRFDQKNGGFGRAPKFPSPHNLMFLLRYWKRTNDAWALHMVEKTLTEMRLGGVYDQIGYGFHRYSTDAHWLIPHFEKMLYDQAMLLIAYTETYLATKNQQYAQVVHEVVEYLVQDMRSPEGAFYSAEDADSEGEEGKFYVWDYEEIASILDGEERDLFIKAFNIKEDGNFLNEATGKKHGANIPHLKLHPVKLAETLGIDRGKLKDTISNVRQKLLDVRSGRVRPHLDDKVLTDWNGLLVAAIAKAARAMEDDEYTDIAREAMEFILQKMRKPNGALLHRYREGEAVIDGFLDDYAFVIWGLIELYETTYEIVYLTEALELLKIQLSRFWDSEHGGFFFTDNSSEALLQRQIDAYDGAIPSGNSVSMYNLVRLGRMLGNPEYEEKAAQVGARFSSIIEQSMGGFSMMLSALDYALGPTNEVVIAGDSEDKNTSKMLQELETIFLPNLTVLLRSTPDQIVILNEIASYTKFHEPIKNKTTAFVCIEQNCKLPTSDKDQMMEMLGKT